MGKKDQLQQTVPTNCHKICHNPSDIDNHQQLGARDGFMTNQTHQA